MWRMYMKKIIIILLCALFLNPVYAIGNNKQKHFLNFNGYKYNLLFSTKNEGGFLNEYYKAGETYHLWSEMLAIHHFPNAYSPIDQVKSFKEYLSSLNCPSALTFNDKNNFAMIDFILIDNNRLPVVMEFNIFKYQKSKKCGSVALQYARRYSVKTAFEAENAKKDFEKNRKKMLKKVKHYKFPAIVNEEIDLCKLNSDVVELANDNKNADITTNEEQETLSKIKIDGMLSYETIVEYQKLPFVDDKSKNDDFDQAELSNNYEFNILSFKDITSYQAPKFVEEQKEVKDKDINMKNVILKEEKTKENSKNNETMINGKSIQSEYVSNRNEKKSLNKNKKEKSKKIYVIKNDKEDFYAKPITKNERKLQNKKRKEEMSKKNKKQRVKNAEKRLKG